MVTKCEHNLVKPTRANKKNRNLKCCHICAPPKPRRAYKPGTIKATKSMKKGIKSLDKFIWGCVRNFINTYSMDDFKVQKGTAGSYSIPSSDYQEEMKNTAYVAVLTSQKNQPEKSREPAYLKTVIVNALIAMEQDSRPRRDNTDNVIDEPEETALVLQAADQFKASEARQDTERLAERAQLTDSERMCIEMKFGFGRGEGYGECKVGRIAHLVGRSENWVRSRLTAAEIKLAVATEK